MNVKRWARRMGVARRNHVLDESGSMVAAGAA